MLNSFGDPDADAAVRAERALLGELHGGCSVPVGALATRRDGILSISAQVTSLDGRERVTGTIAGTDPEAAGAHLHRCCGSAARTRSWTRSAGPPPARPGDAAVGGTVMRIWPTEHQEESRRLLLVPAVGRADPAIGAGRGRSRTKVPRPCSAIRTHLRDRLAQVPGTSRNARPRDGPAGVAPPRLPCGQHHDRS